MRQPEYIGAEQSTISYRGFRIRLRFRNKALELGATDYVVKPYQEEDLLSLIWRLTDQTEN